MNFRIELAERAVRDLRRLYNDLRVRDVPAASRWFDGLEARIAALVRHPRRGGRVPEDASLRQLLYGRRPHVYRIIYEIDEEHGVVYVLHIRHGARDAMAEGD